MTTITTTNTEDPASSVMQLTGGEHYFVHMIDATLLQLRHALGVATQPGEAADPAVDAEFERLRRRMTAFLPEYEEMYRALLTKHLGATLPVCAEALRTAPMRQYFAAWEAMQGELAQGLSELQRRIGNIALSP